VRKKEGQKRGERWIKEDSMNWDVLMLLTCKRRRMRDRIRVMSKTDQ
jgi:hypothetical protein